MPDVNKLEDKFDLLDNRMRNVENLLGRIEVTLDVLTKLHARIDNMEKEVRDDRKSLNTIAMNVQQNALVVNALKWVAATTIPLLLSVMITIAASWFRMGNGA